MGKLFFSESMAVNINIANDNLIGISHIMSLVMLVMTVFPHIHYI